MLKKLYGITFLLMTCTAFAQTGDGIPPPNEGVCDELRGGTPGLYGLCVAFSEAQDCEPDFSLDNPFENCTPSSQKILEAYNKKKKDFDVEMPGIATPCPCWSAEELSGLLYPDPADFPDPPDTPTPGRCNGDYCALCKNGVFSGKEIVSWSVQLWKQMYLDGHYLSLATQASPSRLGDIYSCNLNDRCWGLEINDCLNVVRAMSLTEDEYVACTANVMESGTERGFDCFAD